MHKRLGLQVTVCTTITHIIERILNKPAWDGFHGEGSVAGKTECLPARISGGEQAHNNKLTRLLIWEIESRDTFGKMGIDR